MKRYQLFEFHELPLFPSILRNCITDFLSSFILVINPYKVIAEKVERAVEETHAERIIDLCSGGAQSILSIKREFELRGKKIPIVISDKFPNKKAFRYIETYYGKEVKPLYESIDATDIPSNVHGFRTIFTAFHHFNQNEALSILSDAVKKGQGIGIFEYTERSVFWFLYVLFID